MRIVLSLKTLKSIGSAANGIIRDVKHAAQKAASTVIDKGASVAQRAVTSMVDRSCAVVSFDAIGWVLLKMDNAKEKAKYRVSNSAKAAILSRVDKQMDQMQQQAARDVVLSHHTVLAIQANGNKAKLRALRAKTNHYLRAIATKKWFSIERDDRALAQAVFAAMDRVEVLRGDLTNIAQKKVTAAEYTHALKRAHALQPRLIQQLQKKVDALLDAKGKRAIFKLEEAAASAKDATEEGLEVVLDTLPMIMLNLGGVPVSAMIVIKAISKLGENKRVFESAANASLEVLGYQVSTQVARSIGLISHEIAQDIAKDILISCEASQPVVEYGAWAVGKLAQSKVGGEAGVCVGKPFEALAENVANRVSCER